MNNFIVYIISVQKNRRPCLCTKRILWELNSFLMKNFLLFQEIGVTAVQVRENDL